jgi:hypothetical protein
MDAAVPAVEVADDAHAAGTGRPDGEVNAGDAVESVEMSAELFVGVVVAAFPDEMEIEVAEERWERVGVVEFAIFAAGGLIEDAVGGRSQARGRDGGEDGFEDARGAEAACGDGLSGAGEEDGGLRGPGKKETDGPGVRSEVRSGMRAEECEGVGVASGKEGVDAGVEFAVLGLVAHRCNQDKAKCAGVRGAKKDCTRFRMRRRRNGDRRRGIRAGER